MDGNDKLIRNTEEHVCTLCVLIIKYVDLHVYYSIPALNEVTMRSS